TQVARVATFLAQGVLVQMVLRESSALAAGFGLAVQITPVSGLVSMAIGRAHAIVVGQCLGAGLVERARASLRVALTGVLLSGVLLSVATLWARPFIALFSADPVVIETALTSVRWMVP